MTPSLAAKAASLQLAAASPATASPSATPETARRAAPDEGTPGKLGLAERP